jgi:hypothetical protein
VDKFFHTLYMIFEKYLCVANIFLFMAMCTVCKTMCDVRRFIRKIFNVLVSRNIVIGSCNAVLCKYDPYDEYFKNKTLMKK